MAKRITEDGEVLDTLTHEVIAMAPPFWKTPYNHDRDLESTQLGLSCPEPTKTQQHYLEEVDIKNILAKFIQGAELPITGTPRYVNTEEEFDLQKQMVTQWEVEQAWNKFPIAVRNILKDPATLADYVDHCIQQGDLSPLRELGLADPLPAPPAPPTAPQPGTPAPAAPPPAAAPAAAGNVTPPGVTQHT